MISARFSWDEHEKLVHFARHFGLDLSSAVRLAVSIAHTKTLAAKAMTPTEDQAR